MKTHDVEQRGEAWRLLRAGLPTASAFSNLVTPKTGKPAAAMTTYARMLANELQLEEAEPGGFEGNAWTDRGEDMEDPAVRWYEFITGDTVEQVGFITEEGKGWKAGCSPDGLVGDKGMLETKVLKEINHTEALMLFNDTGKAPAEYRAQTQGQMMISGRQWVDLLFYHERLRPFIIRQLPDPELVKTITSQLVAVCKERDRVLEVLRG